MDTGKGALHTGVYWGEQERDSGRGSWGGITGGEMPDIGDGEMETANHLPCMYLCNNPACFAHVPQNLKCNKI